jgi:hypothetical protein
MLLAVGGVLEHHSTITPGPDATWDHRQLVAEVALPVRAPGSDRPEPLHRGPDRGDRLRVRHAAGVEEHRSTQSTRRQVGNLHSHEGAHRLAQRVGHADSATRMTSRAWFAQPYVPGWVASLLPPAEVEGHDAAA